MPLPPPSPAIAGTIAYKVPRHPAPLDLLLDGIGGLPTPPDFFDALGHVDPARLVQQYPDTAALHELLAARLKLPRDRVLVTAGGDDALDRACRAILGPGRTLLLPTPTFEMIQRYAQWTGAMTREISWSTPTWPLQEVLAQISPDTAAIAIVSPNNPTGAVITAQQLTTLSKAAPHAVLLVDLAYIEFADHDLSELVASLPNAIGFRTLSKAWGLAGLRVGYCFGPPLLIERMRAAGNPYTVTAPSAHLAARWLTQGQSAVDQYVETVRRDRDHLGSSLHALGIDTKPSQANFVFARTPHAPWLRDALAGLGIGIRTWPAHPTLQDAVRINVPSHQADHERLLHAIHTALQPQALLFDLDGVLADVSGSYRVAIQQTTAHFGLVTTPHDIAQAKAEGHANNDWILTHRLLQRARIDVSLDQVTTYFEQCYQGHAGQAGLEATETPLLSLAQFQQWAARYRIGVVTGRPRVDAERFLARHGYLAHVETLVCMEDAPAKPDPAPIQCALSALGVSRAWMLGDTVDDVHAARRAAVLPIGIIAPSDDPHEAQHTLLHAGAARVLSQVSDLQEILPCLASH